MAKVGIVMGSDSDMPVMAKAADILEELGISYEVDGADKLPESGRSTFVCNHTLGGLDGIILLKMLCDKYGEAKVVVNDILMYISPMKSLFIPVNVVGDKQNKESVSLIDECMESEIPILYFPSGKVSRRDKDGNIADLQWKKNFAKASSSKYSTSFLLIFIFSSVFYIRFNRTPHYCGASFMRSKPV